ncbi:DUF2029 domain-containing protein [Chitinophaga lutea]|uniref:DUF2029 domain-containing protein n=1 Tax=Chitinophaga lutea TaxID=2488634 RepID=A0A3N4PZ47_9BACT|nr:glycosyltransferase family 87 protein [Chitinophaga lutea]RPE12169.1 DUF2029 domain-containing protein [Chitinophaga lutea]
MKKRLTLSMLGARDWPALLLWFGLSAAVAAKELLVHNMNNYIIFKHVFLHVRAQQPLYIPYPEYFDVNMYGPLFSLIIAPFALLPDAAGAFLWVMANAAFLYIAIRQLPLNRIQQNLILIFSSHELMAASSYFQFNPAIAACLILSFTCILKGKDFWAAFLIMAGTFTKLYGIAGLAFFFFSRNRLRLTGSLVLWAAVMFALPLALAPMAYILRTYHEWMAALLEKNDKNYRFHEGIVLQNISAMGFIQRVFRLPALSNWWVLGPGLLLFFSQYSRLRWKEHPRYQLYLLASTLLFTVLFSTSSESPTYIIAFPAVCIWYVLQPATKWNNALFIFILIGTSFSHSDLVTPWVKKNIVLPYAFKAFPCLLLWLILVYQVLRGQFLRLRPS